MNPTDLGNILCGLSDSSLRLIFRKTILRTHGYQVSDKTDGSVLVLRSWDLAGSGSQDNCSLNESSNIASTSVERFTRHFNVCNGEKTRLFWPILLKTLMSLLSLTSTSFLFPLSSSPVDLLAVVCVKNTGVNWMHPHVRTLKMSKTRNVTGTMCTSDRLWHLCCWWKAAF